MLKFIFLNKRAGADFRPGACPFAALRPHRRECLTILPKFAPTLQIA